jgi:hypothetical protein
MCKISIYKVVFDTLKLIFGIYLPRRQGGFEICYLLFGALNKQADSIDRHYIEGAFLLKI